MKTCDHCGEIIPPTHKRWCRPECQVAAWKLTDAGKAYRASRRRTPVAVLRVTDPAAYEKYLRQARESYARNREAINARNRAAFAAGKPRPKTDRYVRRLAIARRRARDNGCVILPVTRDTLLAKFAYWGNRCWICGTEGAMTIDHVKPFTKGGPHMLSNIRPACQPCNVRKYNKWNGAV